MVIFSIASAVCAAAPLVDAADDAFVDGIRAALLVGEEAP